MPIRIQLKRTKGWNLQELSQFENGLSALKVTRPGPFGNPFTRDLAIESGFATNGNWQEFVVECFRDWLMGNPGGRDWWQGPKSDAAKAAILSGLPKLRGKNVACYCRLDQPCHGDVLLELANRDETL